MKRPFFLACAALMVSSAAQGLTVLSGTQSASALRPASDQKLSTTFWIQGDDVQLGQLTVNQSTDLKGLSDQALKTSDIGYQAQLLLNTTFSAQIDGAPAQADAVSALQSLVAAASVQGYSAIPSGSYIKFIHTLDFSQQPLPKNAAQITDLYTLQDIPLGLSSTASAAGLWKPAQPKAPVTTPAKVPAKPVSPKVTPKVAAPIKAAPTLPKAANKIPSSGQTPKGALNKTNSGTGK